MKIIHTIHNIADKEVPRRLQVFQKRWFKKGIATPVAISELIQKSISNTYQISKNDIQIIYNGIDLYKCIVKDNYESGTNILHIGRFEKQKNHKELIEIFYECVKKNRKLKLYLVGEGELKKDIEQMVKELNLSNNVKFVGILPECYEILNNSDIFVMTSKWEGMPMTIIEAMGTGISTIAYPVGGIPNMISDRKNGFLPSNKYEFINCIMEISNNKKIREDIGKNATAKAKDYSAEIMAQKYMNLYLK